MQKHISFMILVLLLFVATSVFAWSGKVVNVSEGDIVKVDRVDSGGQIKVRFAGIDSPERLQAYGLEARNYVAGLIIGKTVEVETVGRDRDGRTVAYIWLDGKEINLKIVAAGYAWLYRQYAPTLERRAAKYHNAEASARIRQAGLWQDHEPEPPWQWRQAHRLSRKKGVATSSSDVVVGSYHGDIETRIFHKPGCEFYDCKYCSEGFSSRKKAFRAGFLPCKVCNP